MKTQTALLLGITGVVSGIWMGLARRGKVSTWVGSPPACPPLPPATTVYYYVDSHGRRKNFHARPGDCIGARSWPDGSNVPFPPLYASFAGIGQVRVDGDCLQVPNNIYGEEIKKGEDPIRIVVTVTDGSTGPKKETFDAHVGRCIGC